MTDELDEDYAGTWTHERLRESAPHAGPWSSIDKCPNCPHAFHGLRCVAMGTCGCPSSVPEELR